MTAFDTAPEPDDRPARVGTALVPYRPRPSRMARAFRWWLGVSALVLLACVVFIGSGLYNLDLAPVHIVINGDDVTHGVTVTGMGDDVQALLGVGALMLGLLLLLLVPVLLLLVMASVAIALVIGVGVPLIAVAAVLVAVTSPFWMIGLVVWLVARRRHSPSLPASARMAA
ncbi:MAG: hypothetical protein H7276_17060 [Caulobacter sp.]|nr:hypothetical protein [Vitreoscilla sp.]